MLTFFVSLSLVAAPADDALPHLTAADDALARGDVEAAQEALERAIAVDPKNLDALHGLALVAWQAADYESTIRLLQQILAIDPHDDDARLMLARAQWEAGYLRAAETTVGALLARHPGWSDALHLKTQIGATDAPEPSSWGPLVRADLGVTYDSNVSLRAGALPVTSDQEAASATAALYAGIYHKADERPLSVFGYFTGQSSFTRRKQVDPYLPSAAGLVVTGRTHIGPVLGALDIRYQELYTEAFATHVQRSVGPTVSGAYRIHPRHDLRLELGGIFRTPIDEALPRDFGLRLALKDDFKWGRLKVRGEVALTRNRVTDDATGPVAELSDFDQVGVALYGELLLTETVDLFVFGRGQGRAFETERKESTYLAQVGLRRSWGSFELHGAYGYANNLAGRARAYDRHQVNVGVRFWYQ